jgi:DNA-binding NarL/FixJ family response regulator
MIRTRFDNPRAQLSPRWIGGNEHFSPRQAQIVALVALGLVDKEIAGRLGVSVSTVRTHLQRLYRKMGVHSRARAVALDPEWRGRSGLSPAGLPESAGDRPG